LLWPEHFGLVSALSLGLFQFPFVDFAIRAVAKHVVLCGIALNGIEFGNPEVQATEGISLGRHSGALFATKYDTSRVNFQKSEERWLLPSKTFP
jgi:hypothetical protein